MNKNLVLTALVGTIAAAPSGLRNTDWPKYATTSSAATYANGKLHSLGYGCIRNNFYWAFPQNLAGNSVVDGAGLRTFYPENA